MVCLMLVLVEEQLIFEDNGLLKDKDNNLYQYINIPEYEFSNDIWWIKW